MTNRPRDSRGRFTSAGGGGGGSGVNLGDAYGRVIISDNVDQAMTQAQQAFNRGIAGMGARMQQFGDSVTGVGARITALTAPIAAFGISGINAASRFENALTEIGARAQLTEDELERVRQKALEIGRDTQFSAGQGAEAFLQLLTSGQSMEEAFATIDSVILGATASGENLGFVSDALTDIMAQFGLEADDAGMILQTLTNAAGSSSASFSDLVAGFQNSGGTAALAGMSVEELAATLAVLSENGIKGSEAGTALRSTLAALQRDTEDVTATMDALGISLYDATGNARPMGDVFQDIQDVTADLTDEQRISIFNKLADSYARQGLAALTSGDGIDEMILSMQDGADVADIAASRMDTFQGAVNSLKGSIETLQIEALTPFMNEVLKPLVEDLTEVINKVTEWAAENPELASKIAGVTTAVLVLGPALAGVGVVINLAGVAVSTITGLFGLATTAMGLFTGGVTAAGVASGVAAGAMGVLSAAVAILTSPITLAIAAVAALYVAWETNFLGIRDFVQEVIDDVIGWIDEAIAKIEELFDILSEEGFGGIDRTGEGRGGLFGSGFGPDFDPAGGLRELGQGRDRGGPGEAGGGYLIGSGQIGREMFIPGSDGHFYPDFAKNLAQVAGGVMASRNMGTPNLPENGLSQGDNIMVNIEVPLDVLRNEPQLEQNGETLARSIDEAIRRRG